MAIRTAGGRPGRTRGSERSAPCRQPPPRPHLCPQPATRSHRNRVPTHGLTGLRATPALHTCEQQAEAAKTEASAARGAGRRRSGGLAGSRASPRRCCGSSSFHVSPATALRFPWSVRVTPWPGGRRAGPCLRDREAAGSSGPGPGVTESQKQKLDRTLQTLPCAPPAAQGPSTECEAAPTQFPLQPGPCLAAFWKRLRNQEKAEEKAWDPGRGFGSSCYCTALQPPLLPSLLPTSMALR